MDGNEFVHFTFSIIARSISKFNNRLTYYWKKGKLKNKYSKCIKICYGYNTNANIILAYTAISPNIVTSITLHIIAYVLIVMLMYRMKLIYALLGTSFFLLIMTTTEILYTPYLITYVFKGMVNFQNAYHWYVLLVIPQRIFQIIVANFLWKHEILLATQINRRFHRLFLTSILTLLFGEQLLYFVYVTIFDRMQLVYQITFSVSLLVIVLILNILIFKLVYTVITGLVVKSYNKYCEFENDVKFALDEIRSLLANNKVDEAVKLIEYINE
ncbi:hypothetical protein [Ruminiclostridium josui]|uniref:hypothetical protein n=1 Tax=Ruminiclostridium josui TaxID=1499 RepID=UPI000A528227|nr:hypothetical protein [Ruminiclostridium josui]